MIFGICIACLPLVFRASMHHRTQLYSIAERLSLPFLYLGKTLTSRTSTDQKSTAVYDVERDSEESNSRLVELRTLTNENVTVRGEKQMNAPKA